MEEKLDRLYDSIIATYRYSDESKRAKFKAWFTKNSMLNFIKVFLDNNLKIKPTGTLLFLSRSTVIFRLNRIEEFTGCDIRTFKGALQLLSLLSSSELV